MGSIRVARDTSFAFFFICLCACAVGFACPFWFKSDSQHGGLWQVCNASCTYEVNPNDDDLFLATQILMTISLGLQVVSFGCFMGWFCLHDIDNFRCTSSSALSFCLIASLVGIAAIVCYAVYMDGGIFDWAWYLCTIGSSIQFLTASITLGVTCR